MTQGSLFDLAFCSKTFLTINKALEVIKNVTVMLVLILEVNQVGYKAKGACL
jgi:hypothetical protein